MRVSRAFVLIVAMVAFLVNLAVATTVTMTTMTMMTTSTLTVAPAPLVTDDPLAAHYIATFPQGGSQGIVGTCDAETPTNTSVGTLFTFNINGDPQSGGPFCEYLHPIFIVSSHANLSQCTTYTRILSQPTVAAMPRVNTLIPKVVV